MNAIAVPAAARALVSRRTTIDGLPALACAAVSGVALSLAFPPADLGLLAFVALVPLLHACRGRSARAAFALGGAFGVVSSLAIYHWLREVPAIGVPQVALLAVFVSLYPALWCAALPVLGRSRVPLVLSAPALWVALEALKANAGFLALPWATLAHSQHENLALLQLASVTGEAGVSFVVVMANVAIARWISHRSGGRDLALAAATVAALHAAGALVLRPGAMPGERMTVAAVQPALALGTRDTPHGASLSWQRLEALTLDAASERPALVVWPETVVADPMADAELAARLASLARRAGVPLVVGGAEAAKFAAPSADGDIRFERRGQHNAAYLVLPDGRTAEPYRKRRLVPFAEYRPLPDLVRWPRWLVPARAGEVRAGDGARHWSLPGGLRFAPLICWENLFAPLAREAVRDGAQLLVQLTDDAWFGRSAASRQHNLASVLRAVENGVPVVIASNTGPSLIVDARGRVHATSAPFGPQAVAAAVPVTHAGTAYTRWGPWFEAAAVLLVALALPGALLDRRMP